MKKSYLTKGKCLLLTLVALIMGGMMPVLADNADFEQTLPDGWETVGTMQYYERPMTGSYSIGNSEHKGWEINYGNYIKTTELEGDITFWMRSYKAGDNGYVALYKLSDDGETVGDLLVSFRSSSTTFTEKTYTLTEATRLAIVINYAHLDNMTYTNAVVSPYKKPATLTASDITTNSAVISWTAGSSDGSETGWSLKYVPSAGGSAVEVNSLPVSTLTYTIEDLDPKTSYDVSVKALYADNNESDWRTITFKTAKVATPAAGFTDDFEGDRGWEFSVNGTSPNAWVRGTATNNGGTSAMYISNDGGTSNAYNTSGNMAAYAAKVFSFEAGDYTIKFDWKANGESSYDFLRVALAPADDELNYTYYDIKSNALPTGWIAIDGGSKLNQKTDWQNFSNDITISEAGNYQVVFAWRNDNSDGSQPPAAIDNFKILGAAPVIELSGDVSGDALEFGLATAGTTKTIRITNVGKVDMQNVSVSVEDDADNAFALSSLETSTLVAEGGYTDVEVTFNGSESKTYTATIRVSADDTVPVEVAVSATYSNLPATIAVTLDGEAVGETVDFGDVGDAVEKTFTVTNDGDQTLNVTIASDNTADFTVAPASLEIAGRSSETFTVTFIYDENALFEQETAKISVTPSNEGLTAVEFNATGIRNNYWKEDFESGSLPKGWVTNNWTVGIFNNYGSTYDNETYMALAPSGSTSGTLITPRLAANEGDVLTWDAYLNWYDEALIVEYSVDEQQTWTQIYNYKAQDETGSVRYQYMPMSFTAPAAGSYYLRFTSTYQNGVDNFYGFTLDMPEHSMSIASFAIPTSGLKTEIESQATVTVKENLGVDEENVMAKLYINEEYVANSDAVSFNANEQKTLTIPFIPTTAGDVEMYIEVVYAGGTLKSEAVIRTVAEINKLELTETEEKEITTGYSAVYDVVTLTRSFVAGWNTFVAPQAVAVYDISENAKVYQFDDYADSELKFKTVTDRTLTPATPYIIYLTEAKEVTFTWNNPVIYSSYVGADNIKVAKNGVTFQGTYAPIAAPNMQGMYGVTPAGKIQKGGAGASMKGFRAYFDMGANSAPEFSLLFDGVATGITTATIFDNYEGDIYDLQGRKVNKAQMHKGIYVVNGRKVVVK